ncbi:hypothetical protein QQZ08_007624 [Neonectria magnoliae]|uniref:Uncharacterized protein n=1 Tax=Neonectria magnoliae TaxID=2732573 RepID=A0ABR1HXB6_9HYPO
MSMWRAVVMERLKSIDANIISTEAHRPPTIHSMSHIAWANREINVLIVGNYVQFTGHVPILRFRGPQLLVPDPDSCLKLDTVGYIILTALLPSAEAKLIWLNPLF